MGASEGGLLVVPFLRLLLAIATGSCLKQAAELVVAHEVLARTRCSHRKLLQPRGLYFYTFFPHLDFAPIACWLVVHVVATFMRLLKFQMFIVRFYARQQPQTSVLLPSTC